MEYRRLIDIFADSPLEEVRADLSEANARALIMRDVQLNPERRSFFIEPDLSYIGAEEDLWRSFWLISAPAAVGKSTLAQMLAYDIAQSGRRAMYVPLHADSEIGRDWFGGLLSAVFPAANRAAYQTALQESELVAIVDGYDELSMQESQLTAHTKLMEEILEFIRPDAGSTLPSVIVLFRSALYDLKILEALVPHACQLRLRYLSPNKQLQFFTQYLRGEDVPTGGEEILQGLQHQLAASWRTDGRGETAEIENFLGHAPVLEALGDLVIEHVKGDGGNPSRAVASLQAEVSSGYWAGKLLNRLVENLLKRESTKLSVGFLQARNLEVESERCYPPDFQSRLLEGLVESKVSGAPWDSMIGPAVAEQWQELTKTVAGFATLERREEQDLASEYSDVVRQKLTTHPFLDLRGGLVGFSNPIYEEKYLASLLLSRRVEPSAAFESYRRVSYYLAEFLLQGLPNRDLGPWPHLVYYTIRSLLMAGGDDLTVSIERSDSGWRLTVLREERPGVLEKEGEDFWYQGDVLDLYVPSGEMLESIAVDGKGEGGVIVTIVDGEPSVGRLGLSQVAIRAPSIYIDSGHLLCEAVKLEGHIIFAEYLAEIDGLDTLEIAGTVEANEFLRQRYGNLLTTAPAEPVEKEALRRKLNGMLTWFRKRGKGRFAIFERRWRTAVLSKGQDGLAVALYEFLTQLGMLYTANMMVELRVDVAAAYGIHYVKQNRISFGEEFDALYEQWREFYK